MAANKTEKPSNRIPIHFVDGDDSGAPAESRSADDHDDEETPFERAVDRAMSEPEPDFDPNPEPQAGDPPMGGPDFAELVACRAELKRLEPALAEARETAARRQA